MVCEDCVANSPAAVRWAAASFAIPQSQAALCEGSWTESPCRGYLPVAGKVSHSRDKRGYRRESNLAAYGEGLCALEDMAGKHLPLQKASAQGRAKAGVANAVQAHISEYVLM